jgi:hypothetical protein
MAGAGNETGQGITELRGVVLLEVDLVNHSVKAEADDFHIFGCGAIEVVDELNENLLSHAKPHSTQDHCLPSACHTICLLECSK